MGHDVEQRVVDIGENLDQYDRVILFLAGPRQLVAGNSYRGMYTASQVENEKLILAFDDWQTTDIMKGLNACLTKEGLTVDFIKGLNKIDEDVLQNNVDNLLTGVEKIVSKTNKVLLSAFAGGNLELLVDWPSDLLYGYNPNPFHHNRKPGDRGNIPLHELDFMTQQLQSSVEADTIDPYEKKKIFNFASLVQSKTKKWLKKQDVKEWDIEFFGSKKDGQRRLVEGDMVHVYAEQWGSLMPGYDHAGSGWWRARPLQVADAGSILIGEPAEMQLYYTSDDLINLKAADLEAMDVDQLAVTAKRQKDELYLKHPLDKLVQIAELEKVLA